MSLHVLDGGISVDDRGTLLFHNELPRGLRRLYVVSNHEQGFVRAWHGHREEEKWVTVLRGAALIGAVEVDDWHDPDPSLPVETMVLAASAPRLLHIPAGYANGAMSLTPFAQVAYLSTSTLEESRRDDVRWPSRYWDPWTVQER